MTLTVEANRLILMRWLILFLRCAAVAGERMAFSRRDLYRAADIFDRMLA